MTGLSKRELSSCHRDIFDAVRAEGCYYEEFWVEVLHISKVERNDELVQEEE